jgi:hypothetical protein
VTPPRGSRRLAVRYPGQITVQQLPMATTFAFLGMLLISMVVALLAALQLGDFFGANSEFGVVILTVSGFTVFSLLVFALAHGLARRSTALTWMAWALAVCALVPIALPGLIQKIADRSTNPYTVGTENTSITIELVVPALLAVLVQWGLVRRRWLRVAGSEQLTRWPWVTTAVAGFAILNPLGLSLLQTSLVHSASDFMWEFVATVTGSALAALLVMAWIECYIRDRILNRRLAAGLAPQQTPRDGNAEAPI